MIFIKNNNYLRRRNQGRRRRNLSLFQPLLCGGELFLGVSHSVMVSAESLTLAGDTVCAPPMLAQAWAACSVTHRVANPVVVFFFFFCRSAIYWEPWVWPIWIKEGRKRASENKITTCIFIFYILLWFLNLGSPFLLQNKLRPPFRPHMLPAPSYP